MSVNKKKIKDYQFDQSNINKGSEYGNALLGKSLQEVGLGRSVLADKNGFLIAGNKTVEKAAEMGFEDVLEVETDGKTLVVVKRSDLDINSEMGVKMKILDNTVSKHNYVEDAEVSEAICEEYQIDAKEYGITVEEEKKLVEEDEYEFADSIVTDIVRGDLFEIGPHRLLCGDSTDSDDIEKLMDGQKAQMVLTDPPYEIEIDYANILLVAEHANVFIFNNDRNLISQLKNSPLTFKKFFVFNHNACAIPQEGGNEAFLTHILISHETIGEAPKYIKGGGTRTVIAGEYRRSENHKHEKPNGLLSDLITPYSNEGDLIIDLFLGSGATMVTADQLNRKCYGLELDPKNCQVIVNRMVAQNPNIKIKRNGLEYLHK